MKIIIVDDEQPSLHNLTASIKQVEPQAELFSFSAAEDAFDFLSRTAVDIAFLDIEMGEYNGITLAIKSKMLCPKINIIFVTAHSQYALDALRLRASGYLLKPVRMRDLQLELENLRCPLPFPSTKRIRIQTFGYFEIFVDDQPLKFPRSKCRECLAYLVDRKGARVTYPELSAILWEDKPINRTVQNSTHKAVSDMMKVLKSVDLQDIIIKSRHDIALNTTLVDCDYLSLLNGDFSQLNAFNGEYMSNYSWAEFTLGRLLKN